MDFLHAIWLVLVIFAFLCYLMVLWSILGDLFADHKLSGWWKALWIICLFIFPLITALIYLIARGQGMARRQRESAAKFKQQQDDYIRGVVAKDSPAQQIADAKSLLDAGTIDQAEFDALKAKALAEPTAASA